MRLSAATRSALDELDLPLAADLSELAQSSDMILYTLATDALELYNKLQQKLKQIGDYHEFDRIPNR